MKISVKMTARPTSHYSILIGKNLFDLPLLFSLKKFSKIVIITDHVVKKRYGLSFNQHLIKAGFNSLLLSFPAGEKFKNIQTKQKLENALFSHHCGRDTLIVALGGGVVGDLAGYIAATFLRGVSYIQIPTTLLAMVDSSVGGKTGINTKHGKNLIGAIYQPKCVIADIAVLKTLSKTSLIHGLIEAIKMFLTHDAKSFHYAELHLQQIIKGEKDFLKNIVPRAVKIKSSVVARDENEKGERSLLNFGHTIGHALEKITHYKLLHGYAVAYGILVEATLSHLLGILDKQALLRIIHLMSALGIHGKDLKKFNINKIIQATRYDKKVRLGIVRYTLLKKIGSAYRFKGKYTCPVSDNIVKKAFKLTIDEVNDVG